MRINVHCTYCGNHFMVYVSQIIMLYTLNLYSAECQLYLNKTRRKKKEYLTTSKTASTSRKRLTITVAD